MHVESATGAELGRVADWNRSQEHGLQKRRMLHFGHHVELSKDSFTDDEINAVIHVSLHPDFLEALTLIAQVCNGEVVLLLPPLPLPLSPFPPPCSCFFCSS